MEFILAMLILTAGTMVLATIRATMDLDEAQARVYAAEEIKHTAPEITKEEIKEMEEEFDYLWTDDRLLIAQVVMAEAGTEPFVGKVAVAATILNRAELRGMTIPEVIYEENQYAKPWVGTLEQDVFEAVDFAVENRDLFPKNMFFFRTHHFHRMAFADDYIQIGNHYFSVDNRYTETE